MASRRHLWYIESIYHMCLIGARTPTCQENGGSLLPVQTQKGRDFAFLHSSKEWQSVKAVIGAEMDAESVTIPAQKSQCEHTLRIHSWRIIRSVIFCRDLKDASNFCRIFPFFLMQMLACFRTEWIGANPRPGSRTE